MGEAQTYDAVIVGAGFSGLYMLHRLRQQGVSARVFEAGDSVGGTWFWNRYPGARVDIESQEYSYSFSPELDAEWKWTERYAAQPELLAYLNHVADRFDLRRDIQLDTRVTAAVFDEAAHRWTVTTDRGETVSARYCVMATGCLSVPKDGVEIPGAETFKGPSWHTGRWPKEGVDFTGKTVAVIGTGSSAIQSIPQIAAQATHVTVFQRTPNFSAPAHNGPVDPAVVADWAANRAQYRQEARNAGFGVRAIAQSETPAFEATPEQRQANFEERWRYGGFALLGAFSDLVSDPKANDTAAEFVREQIREIVKDPAVAEKLAPKTYPVGSKRLCVDTGYYATFNRDNVSLVDLTEEPIETITPAGVKTGAKEYAVDAIVYAIGFDAMTGALDKIDIRGARRRQAEGRLGGGPTHLPRPDGGGFPEPVPGHRTRQPVGALQHGRCDRAARRVDRRLHRLDERAPGPEHRGHHGGAGRVGRARQRGGRGHHLPARQQLVPGRQRARQTAGLHALHRRLPGLPRQVQRGRRQGLRGLRGGGLTAPKHVIPESREANLSGICFIRRR